MWPMQKAVETHYSVLKLAQSCAIPACFQEKNTIGSGKILCPDMKSITLNNEKLT